jgi:type I restriction enzyme S subunit
MRVAPDELSHFTVRDGDIFVCEGGEPGRAAVWRNGDQELIFQKALHRLRVLDGMQPDYLAQYVRFAVAQHEFSNLLTGTTIKHLPQVALQRMRVAVSPAAEQRRIVTKLDVLTSRVARTRAELDRVPILVSKMKLESLKACFEEAGQEQHEFGALLRSIEAGKNLRCEERPPRDGELGVVKVSAVTWGSFDPRQSKTLPSDYVPPEKARIRSGDLLISRANTLELVGAVVLVDRQPNGLFLSDKILRLVLVDEDAKKWVLWFLRSPFGREQIERLATGNQLSMRNISQDALRRIRLPFPSSHTRRRLIQKVETSFARADRLKVEAARARTLLDRLEFAILAKAFRGELIAQDPNDEPASVLLSRIRAARGQQAQSKPKRGRRASVPKAPREKAVMTKSRQDEDVKNKPYLADIIREAGGSSKVEDLFSKADLPVTDFYKQLAWEVDQGHIRDQNNQILQVA